MAPAPRVLLLALAFAALAALGPAPSWAEGAGRSPLMAWLGSPRALVFQAGTPLILNNDPEVGTQSAAIHLAGDLGIGADYALGQGGRFSFEPSLTLYDSYYALSTAGKAVPVGFEEGQVYLVAFLLDFSVGLTLPLSPTFDLAATAGLGLDLRLGFLDDAAVATATADSINAYFWSKGRFVMPSTGLRADLKLSDRLTGSFRAKVFWPLADLWAGEGLGLLDQALIDLGFSVRYTSKAK